MAVPLTSTLAVRQCVRPMPRCVRRDLSTSFAVRLSASYHETFPCFHVLFFFLLHRHQWGVGLLSGQIPSHQPKSGMIRRPDCGCSCGKISALSSDAFLPNFPSERHALTLFNFSLRFFPSYFNFKSFFCAPASLCFLLSGSCLLRCLFCFYPAFGSPALSLRDNSRRTMSYFEGSFYISPVSRPNSVLSLPCFSCSLTLSLPHCLRTVKM